MSPARKHDPGAPGSWSRSLFLAWRKVIEHLLYSLIKSLDVLIRLGGQVIARRSPPDELLAVRIEQVDNKGTDLIVVNRCSCVSESASPAPAASKPVVEGIEGTLIMSHLDRHDRDVTARWHLGPTFCSQGRIDC